MKTRLLIGAIVVGVLAFALLGVLFQAVDRLGRRRDRGLRPKARVNPTLARRMPALAH